MRAHCRLKLTAIAICGVCVACAAASASQLQAVRVENGSTGTRALLTIVGQTDYKTIDLAHPNRLVVDFAKTSAAANLALPKGQGVIRSVRIGHPNQTTLRVVFDLTSPVVAFEPQLQDLGPNQLVSIQWPSEEPSPVLAPANIRASNAAASQSTDASASLAPELEPTTQPLEERAPPPLIPQPVGVMGNRSTLTERDRSGGLDLAHAADLSRATTPEPLTGWRGSSDLVKHRSLSHRAVKMRTLIIAIDPGHGGQDTGAIGLHGRCEKDVTLAISLALAKLINATPGMHAFLTRTTDVFIPLPQRAQKARLAKADMFVSVHADASENRTASGSSVFVLSTKGASSQRARWLADKENDADLIGGVQLQQTESTLANVLLDLAQSGHMKASEDAADSVLDGLKHIATNHRPQLERANFAVLRTSDVPAMLIETAFISNPREEKLLGEPRFQRRIASAIMEGISGFFASQPPPDTVFAARAQTRR